MFEPLKLNIGAWGTRIPGFTSIDIEADSKPDIHGDFRAMDFGEAMVAEIYCSHVLEHFFRGEAERIIATFAKWLVDGGILWLAVPDFTRVATAYIEGCDTEHVRGLLYGGCGKPHHNHHSGWTRTILKASIERAGFEWEDDFQPFVKNAEGTGGDFSSSWVEWPKGNACSASLNFKCRRLAR